VNAKSLYEFKALDIDKKEVDLKIFEGKVCLVVNVRIEKQ
jgi:glutathione peroxidase-family protein